MKKKKRGKSKICGAMIAFSNDPGTEMNFILWMFATISMSACKKLWFMENFATHTKDSVPC